MEIEGDYVCLSEDKDPFLTSRNVYKHMDDQSGSIEIPVWVNGTQKWVTGLTKRTTCDDVVYALLCNDGIHDIVSTQEYAIFEKWREVERPLQGRTKIIKVWRTWGPEQANVQLSLRRIDELEYSGEFSLTRRRHRKSRHRSRDRHHNYCQNTSERLKSMETLVKMILSQERTLKDLAQRVSETDQMIEKYESKLNFSRIKNNGQNTYIEGMNEDGLDDILANVEVENMEIYLEFCDKIIQVEEKIESERLKFEELAKLIQEYCKSRLSESDSDSKVTVENELTKFHVELNRVVSSSIMQQYKSQDIVKEIQFYELKLRDKSQLLEQLQKELSDVESLEQIHTGENWNNEYHYAGKPVSRLYSYDTSALTNQNKVVHNPNGYRTNQQLIYDDRNPSSERSRSVERVQERTRLEYVPERKPILKQGKGQKSDQPRNGALSSSESKVRFKADSLVDKYNWDESSFSEELSVDHSDSDNRDNFDHMDHRASFTSWGHSLPPAIPPKPFHTHVKTEENDSNSDTGLSSMHSDDSAVYQLETLV
ncbi:hypothetical protein CHS0354_018294 [Potamilus streckersoni]|uniref:Ras-associating domain-containing protein n=1 Tax=Potamilus streckersoni TaxID=2493646 RepID=A0AAE0TJM2_9BIVA|nr:hypothetical protein CHS0354_018294 [Potamilus streckersoni]